MPAPVLYLGDTSLTSDAGYLAGLLTAAGLGFDYVASDESADEATVAGRRLVIVSDYPSKMLSPNGHERLAEVVHEGTGLLMIGGWESYHGVGGDWDRSAIARVLPVTMATDDDRVNCDQPAIVRSVASHPTVQGLPWNDRPPGIGGFNRFAVAPGGTLVLELVRHTARWHGNQCQLWELDWAPLLVVGQHGAGRTAALATDVAPHWVGGLVDWGPERFKAQAPGAGEIEVGNYYARFFEQLVCWTGGMDAPSAA